MIQYIGKLYRVWNFTTLKVMNKGKERGRKNHALATP